MRASLPWFLVTAAAGAAAMAGAGPASGPAGVGAGPSSRPVASPERIAALIGDLGADSYRVRQAASDELRRIGAPARTALEEATKSKDAEVRIRAEEILKDIRLGLSPDWPAEMIRLVRRYDRLSEPERIEALARISRRLKGESAGLLLRRMVEGSGSEPVHALRCLEQIGTDAVYRKVLALVDEPANAYQARALARAHAHLGSPLEALRVLARHELDAPFRHELIEAGAHRLRELLKHGAARAAAKEAAGLAELLPGDARFLYLQAEALVALDQDRRAEELCRRALGLNPKEESPHYTAGELLLELGRRELSAREWEKILEIPPAGGVYDINAHLRLGRIYSECKQYGRAADSLSKALELYEEARKTGGGMGMIGGTVDQLRDRIRRFRRKAAAGGGAAKLTDELPPDRIDVNVQVAVKDGKLKALREALKQAAATLSVDVQPHGLRLFDATGASVRYDAQKQEVGIYLNKSPCGKPAPLRLTGTSGQVAVKTLDCVYIFRVDAAGGRSEKIARFEKDYTVTFRAGRKVAAWDDVKVTINGKPHAWQKLLAGAEFDYLPKSFDIVLTGTRPSGQRAKLEFKIKLREPAVP